MASYKIATLRAVGVLLVTLIIGIFLGMSIAGSVIRGRVAEIQRLNNQNGFVEQTMALVAPVGQAQADTVQAIVRTHGRAFAARMEESRARFFEDLEDLEAALEPHLTQAQMERLRARRVHLESRVNRYGDEE